MKLHTRIQTIHPSSAYREIKQLSNLLAIGWEIAATLHVGDDAVYVLSRKMPWWRRFVSRLRSEEPVFPENEGKAVYRR